MGSCRYDVTCAGVDFDTNFNECFKHTNTSINNARQANPGVKHFQKFATEMECESSQTFSLLLILWYNSDEILRTVSKMLYYV